MKTNRLIALLLALGIVLTAFNHINLTDTYKVDVTKSMVKWVGKKVTGQHNGTIKVASGEVMLNKGKLSGGSFEIDMSTIICEDLTDEEMNTKLVGHLKSDDFFGVEKYPLSKFTITKAKAKGDEKYQISGEMTIKGATHKVEFPAQVIISDEMVKAEATIVLDRTKWGIKYGSGSFFDNLGDKMIYDDFEVSLTLVATK